MCKQALILGAGLILYFFQIYNYGPAENLKTQALDSL